VNWFSVSAKYRAHGLIRTWDASAVDAHDGARLPDLVSNQITASGIWADTAYRPKKNEAFLAKSMLTSHIHQKREPRRPLPEHIARANARRSKVRAAVEHKLAEQNTSMGLCVRTIGIMGVVVEACDGCFLDSSVHPFDLTVGLRMLRLGRAVINMVSGGGQFENVSPEYFAVAQSLPDQRHSRSAAASRHRTLSVSTVWIL
jgi:hypothetical protein